MRVVNQFSLEFAESVDTAFFHLRRNRRAAAAAHSFGVFDSGFMYVIVRSQLNGEKLFRSGESDVVERYLKFFRVNVETCGQRFACILTLVEHSRRGAKLRFDLRVNRFIT